MDRAGKQALVSTLHTTFKSTGLVVVAHYGGMTVAQMSDYRKRVKEAGGQVKVAKNKLAKIALKDTNAEAITGLFKGPTVISTSKDPIAAARVAVAYAKTNEKLIILGGAMGKTVLDPQGVKTLAELPSLDELRAKFLGMLQTPASQFVRTLNEPAAKLARVLHAKAAQGDGAKAETAPASP